VGLPPPVPSVADPFGSFPGGLGAGPREAARPGFAGAIECAGSPKRAESYQPGLTTVKL